MTAFITPGELRAALANTRATDENALTEACEVACGVVEDGWTDSTGWHPGVGPVLTTTVTAERVVAGVCRYRPVALTAVADWRTGSALTLADYRIVGQVIERRDGGRIPSPLEVSYTTGHGEAPAWAKDAALAIAEQLFRRRFKLGQQVDGPIGFLVPHLTVSLLASHQLTPLGFA